jgi:benzoate/toluate 1,2-dioxygenase beta subunit
MPDASLVRQLEEELSVRRLLAEEVRLLDAREFDAWLALLTDDFVYHVPCGPVRDPARQVSIAYDDRTRVEERVWRLQSGLAHSQLPPSRTQHVVSDVAIRARDGEELTVGASFVLAEVRSDVQTLFVGSTEHRLRRGDGPLGWRIARKTVNLLNSDSPLGNLSFIL